VVGDAVRGLRANTAHVATAVDRPSLEALWAVRRLASPALARLPENRRSLQVVETGACRSSGWPTISPGSARRRIGAAFL